MHGLMMLGLMRNLLEHNHMLVLPVKVIVVACKARPHVRDATEADFEGCSNDTAEGNICSCVLSRSPN